MSACLLCVGGGGVVVRVLLRAAHTTFFPTCLDRAAPPAPPLPLSLPRDADVAAALADGFARTLSSFGAAAPGGGASAGAAKALQPQQQQVVARVCQLLLAWASSPSASVRALAQAHKPLFARLAQQHAPALAKRAILAALDRDGAARASGPAR